MCIAIFKPADKNISKETLKTCFDNNDDGAGFAYINTDLCGVRRIKIKKYMKFEEFYTAYERAIKIAPDSPFIIHFRIGTHGEKTTFNCHPFWVKKDLVFIHNGIISGVGTDKRMSDTQLFNEKILKQLPKGWERNNAICHLIQGFVGMSKLIFLNLDGDYMIINEKQGDWVDGIWYSNTSYKPRSYSRSYSTYRLPEKTTNTRRFWEIAENDFETCELCGCNRQLKWMKPYKLEGQVEPLLLCYSCAKEQDTAGVVNSSNVMSIKDYIKETNAREAKKYSSGTSQDYYEYAC